MNRDASNTQGRGRSVPTLHAVTVRYGIKQSRVTGGSTGSIKEIVMKLRYLVKHRGSGQIMSEVEAESYSQAANQAALIGFDRQHYFVSLVG